MLLCVFFLEHFESLLKWTCCVKSGLASRDCFLKPPDVCCFFWLLTVQSHKETVERNQGRSHGMFFFPRCEKRTTKLRFQGVVFLFGINGPLILRIAWCSSAKCELLMDKMIFLFLHESFRSYWLLGSLHFGASRQEWQQCSARVNVGDP